MTKALFILIMWFFSDSYYGQSEEFRERIQNSTGINKIDLINQYISLSKNENFEELENYAKIALKNSKKLKYSLGIAKSYESLGSIAYKMTNYNSAIDYYWESLKIYHYLNKSLSVADQFSNIGQSYRKIGIVDSAITNLRKCYNIRIKKNEMSLASGAMMTIGVIQIYSARFENAYQSIMKALEIRKELKDSSGIASVYNNLGVLYWRKGNLDISLNYYRDSYNIRMRNNLLKESVFPKLNIGLLISDLKDYEFAEKEINEGIKISRELNYDNGLAIGYLYLAEIALKRKQFRDIMVYGDSSLVYMKILNEKLGWARVHNIKALGFLQKRQFHKAKYHLSLALGVLENYTKLQLKSEVYLNYAKIFFEERNYNESLAYLNKSFKYSQGGKLLKGLLEYYKLETRVYKKLNQPHNALNSLQKYSEIRDSIYNDRTMSSIQHWKAKFENSKKESEINILRAKEELNKKNLEEQRELKVAYFIFLIVVSTLLIILSIYIYYRRKLSAQVKLQRDELRILNTELELSNKELVKSNSTKDKLFSIVSHDLRNPYLSLFGLTESLYKYIDEYDQDEIKESAEFIFKSARKLLNLSENLLEWARINSQSLTPHFEEIKIRYALNSVIDNLKSILKKKCLRIEVLIPEELEVLCDIYMLNTIIMNLLTNAIKFSEKGSKIDFIAVQDSEKIKIIVKDYGVGMDSDVINKIISSDVFYSTAGTESEKGSGLGLKITKEFIKMNNAQLEIKSEIGVGSEFILYFNQAKK